MSSQVADLALVNGRIHVLDEHDQLAESVAIRDGRVVGIGKTDRLNDLIESSTEVVDLKGKGVVPGFVDAHCHLGPLGSYAISIDCRSPGVGSVEAILAQVAERAQKSPPGTWIRGRGYDHTRLSEGRHPNRSELDRVAPNHPVLLTRVCGHYSAFNSKAMEAAGLSEEVGDPPSGSWDRDGGRLLGLARETAQKPLLDASRLSADETREALEYAQKAFLDAGCTSVHDAGGLLGERLRVLLGLLSEERWKIRVYAFAAIGAEGADVEAAYGATRFGGTSGFGNDRVRIGAFKLMTDGSSSGPSAATREPYEIDPNDSGVLIWDQTDLESEVRAAHESGFQVAMHAVGDRAIENALAAYRGLGAWSPREQRHRIEHCALLPEDLQEAVAEAGVIPVMQPVFLYEFGDGYVKSYGRERAETMFPTATMLRRGVPVAGSSDAPVTDHRPLFGMQIAMTRTTQSGDVLGADHSASFSEALRMYTMNGSYASFDEHRTGSLEVGKQADLVIFEEDPGQVDPHRLGALEPILTMINGEAVFERQHELI